jgi:DNA-binding transcriptional ArsR family regulator
VSAAVRPLLALLCLASLALPGAAAPAMEVDFHLPAQADGGLAAAGPEWAILLFHGAGASVHLDLAAGGSATNHTRLWVRPGPPGPGSPYSLNGADLPAQALPDGLRGELAFPAGAWASLYVAADHLELEALEGHATLGRAQAGDNADAYLPAQGAAGTYRTASHAIGRAGAWTAWQGEHGAPIPVRLRASGVHTVEWHNGTVACSGSTPCPAPAGTDETPLAPGVGSGALIAFSYLEVQAPGGTLAGSGDAVLLAAGGPRFDLGVAGSLRLPDAALRGACPAGPCPDPAGRTLLARGNLTLAGLAAHPSDPDRLKAGLDGVASASLDESPAPMLSPAAAVAVGAALVALPLLVKVLLGLFARSARPPALQHPKRQALYDLVRAEPGLSFRAIQRRLGWPHGTLSNHMARLLDVGLVVARPYRNTVRFFENHGRYDATWGEAVLLRDPHLRGLHAWLLEHPHASQGDVLERWAAEGWKRSTVQDRLRALAEGGLVEAMRDGRRILYSARQARLPAELTDGPESAVTPQ